MKTIFIIYIVISILTFIFSFAIAKIARQKVKKESPDVEFEKITLIEKIFSWVRVIILCSIPLYNFLVFMMYVFRWDNMVDMAMEKFYEREKI